MNRQENYQVIRETVIGNTRTRKVRSDYYDGTSNILYCKSKDGITLFSTDKRGKNVIAETSMEPPLFYSKHKEGFVYPSAIQVEKHTLHGEIESDYFTIIYLSDTDKYDSNHIDRVSDERVEKLAIMLQDAFKK